MQDDRVIYPTLDRDRVRGVDPDGNILVETLQHAQFPIEGAGVVHVVTELPDTDPGYGYTDVTLARYVNGDLLDHIPVTGSVWKEHRRGSCTNTGATLGGSSDASGATPKPCSYSTSTGKSMTTRGTIPRPRGRV